MYAIFNTKKLVSKSSHLLQIFFFVENFTPTRSEFIVVLIALSKFFTSFSCPQAQLGKSGMTWIFAFPLSRMKTPAMDTGVLPNLVASPCRIVSGRFFFPVRTEHLKWTWKECSLNSFSVLLCHTNIARSIVRFADREIRQQIERRLARSAQFVSLLCRFVNFDDSCFELQ